MRHRSLLAAFAALALLFAPGPKVSAATSFSFSLRVGDPYIGPQLAFYEEPDVVLIPGTRVYYVDDYDYDLYRYGNYWYYYWNGGWYRSYDYDGPFYFISYQSVPYTIRYVPMRYRHHWRSYRGAAYSSYRAGRYYPSNPGSYTYYRTRYENRYPSSRGQFSVEQNRYRQRQQPVQQERAPQPYRQQRSYQRDRYQQRAPQRVQQQAPQVEQEQPRVQSQQYRRQQQSQPVEQQAPQREYRQRQQQQQAPQGQQNRGSGDNRGQGNQKQHGQGRGHGKGQGNGNGN